MGRNINGSALQPFQQVPPAVGAMSPDESPELARIVQEVVNSPNWHFGGSLAFLLHGTSGHRSAWAFDGNPSLAPSLVLQVVEEGAPSPLPSTPAETQL